ncbi:ATP-binding protein [Sphingomonas sp. CBMAI 2297]|uniref:sensor histidine kinase n=1 Tax=Sphingomonas sp. CBMAI 2297 TaxID=2991720 RepID=UPI00245464E7|nr:histidine kinase dimerization/phosphoacceptor domain -containing protein [Sphingomonas sp. CBMAI 2297]MDH4742675.1 ATP-binding protein [Sphingomonas sp. CBMAI 2297]
MTQVDGEVRWPEKLPLLEDRPWLQLGLTLAITGIALLIRLAIGNMLPPGLPYATFLPGVIVTAFLFGVRPGLLAAVLGGILGWVFFIKDPLHDAPLPGVAPSIFLYLSAGTLVLLLFHWMQTVTHGLIAQRERNHRLAETRTLLFHELQHRVSNNLQVAAGLLALQKRHVGDPAAQAALDEAARRVGTIGRISRQLYRSDGGARGVRALLAPLAGDVIAADGKPVALAIEDPDALELAPDAAVPVALIVAEAVANAIEHGFGGREGGRIVIRCRRREPGFAIEIEDDGQGLPPGFDITRHASLGLHIAATLAGQLGGRFEMAPRPGGALARLAVP